MDSSPKNQNSVIMYSLHADWRSDLIFQSTKHCTASGQLSSNLKSLHCRSLAWSLIHVREQGAKKMSHSEKDCVFDH